MSYDLSVVVPVYNEAKNLELLTQRLVAVLTALKRSFEIIYVNDGSHDNSSEVLQQLFQKYPKQLKIIEFAHNFGQHPAIMAGFELSTGQIVVTLDADLQNPPEEIPKLLQLADQGYDLVSGVRLYERKDSWFRRNISIFINKIRAKITNIHMTDHGCMLRAYHQKLVKLMVQHHDATPFIPALAYNYATKPTEITVAHAERFTGESQYSLYKLAKLSFALITGNSVIPLQLFALVGAVISGIALIALPFLIFHWLFTSTFNISSLLWLGLFFTLGLILGGIGVLGEYLGRVTQNLQQRPLFIIKKIWGENIHE